MKNNRSRSNNRVWPVVLLAAVITVAALALVFGPDAAKYLKAQNTQDRLQQLYKGASASVWDALFPAACAEETETADSEMAKVHDDFAALYAENNHLVGWLKAGESIDYPVVQYDNTYYLDHDYFGSEDPNGTLFLNEANLLEPRDSILLIHGHNMKSGAMFGNLDRYRDKAYLQDYPLITFRTVYDEEDVYYTPIAAFDASMIPGDKGYFDITRIRFDSEWDESGNAVSSELEDYIAAMRDISVWDSPAAADSTDAFISLVTCSYDHDDGRFVLVCRRLRADETADSIRDLFAAG